ncbi:N-acetyltransferase [Sulfurimonas sp.]|uniref:N-acetyltransferase n=1 Tax=Sulfurimonas sp. TaxID=2022749 RepID=UPI002B48D2A2|nr:N-acetyltransferase [Sulfurimonas sp.]
MINYQKAKLSNITKMQELVSPEIESGIILNRTDDEVSTNIRSYTLCLDDEKIVGFCALHIHTQYLGEIRSLVVRESERGKKIGKKLVEQCLEEAKNLKLQKVLSLTYKQSFFEKLGFIEISKDSIPEHKIWADCIKCKHFPVCNEVSLIKAL